MEDLEENLQIHLDKILMIGAKVIIDTESEEEASLYPI